MKYLFIMLVIAYSALASDCVEYGKKAVHCFENGVLLSHYDETGNECGLNDNFWEISPSTNKTILVRTLDYREYGYMVGQAWESECAISFKNDSQFCSFEMILSLGTEDADVSINNLKCR